MEQVFTTNLVLDNSLLQFKWACETTRRQLQEGSSYFLFPGQLNLTPNLTPTRAKILDALGLSFTVLCKLYTETCQKFLTTQKEKEQSKRPSENWPKSNVPSALHMATPQSPPLLLHITARPSLYFSNNTSSFQRHSSGKSSTHFSNLTHSRTPGNEGWVLTVSFLTIVVPKSQLCNLFSATTCNSNVGAVLKIVSVQYCTFTVLDCTVTVF